MLDQNIAIPPRNLRSIETASLKQDLTGRKFGRLFVVSFSHKRKRDSYWVCACTCGNISDVRGHNLKSGQSKSCGCLHREMRPSIAKAAHTTHGMGKTRIYRIWGAMKSRCYRKRDKAYLLYGGRGIFVCDEWRNAFEPFRDWALANGYCDNLEIDRIDNMKGYSPENCRFVTRQVNVTNRRCVKLYAFHGKMLSITEIARIAGVWPHTVRVRLKKGIPLDQALSKSRLSVKAP